MELAQAPCYDALSSMWGSATPEDEIDIEGRTHRITKNLGQGLRRVREQYTESESILIWAVGICINQRSIRERNHQVTLMRDIFRSAKRVLIWVDISTNVANPWFSFKDHSGAAANDDHLSSPTGHSVTSGTDYADDLRNFKQRLNLLLHPYWRRIWIQGEVFNVNKILLYIRKASSTHDAVYALLKNMSNFALQNYRKLWASPKPEKRIPATVMGLYAAVQHHTCLARISDGRPHRPTFSTLTNLMAMHKDMGVTDYRAVVYGLMQLASDYEEGSLVVDYALTVQEVFMAAFSYHVRRHCNLNFLHIVEYGSLSAPLIDTLAAEEKEIGDPSWGKLIADGPVSQISTDLFPQDSWLQSWSASCSISTTQPDMHCASGQIPCLSDAISQSNHTIKTQGFRLDIVARVIKHVSNIAEFSDSVADYWTEVSTLLPTLVSLTNWNEARTDLQPPDETTWELLTFDHPEPPSWADTISAMRFWQYLVSDDEISNISIAELYSMLINDEEEDQEEAFYTPRKVLSKILLGLYHRTRLALGNGAIGQMVDYSAREGDQVWILFGCHYPMVLRPMAQYYELVGYTFMPGYMEGQAVGGADVKGPFRAGDMCNGNGVKEIQIW